MAATKLVQPGFEDESGVAPEPATFKGCAQQVSRQAQADPFQAVDRKPPKQIHGGAKELASRPRLAYSATGIAGRESSGGRFQRRRRATCEIDQFLTDLSVVSVLRRVRR